MDESQNHVKIRTVGSSLSECSGNYYGFVAGYRRTAAAAQPFGRITPAGVGVSHTCNTVDRGLWWRMFFVVFIAFSASCLHKAGHGT